MEQRELCTLLWVCQLVHTRTNRMKIPQKLTNRNTMRSRNPIHIFPSEESKNIISKRYMRPHVHTSVFMMTKAYIKDYVSINNRWIRMCVCVYIYINIFCIKFIYFLLEVQLAYIVILISATQQSDSVLHIYTFFFKCSFPLWFIPGD